MKKWAKYLLCTMVVGVITTSTVYAEDYNTLINNCTKVSNDYKLNTQTIDSQIFITKSHALVELTNNMKKDDLKFDSITLIYNKDRNKVDIVFFMQNKQVDVTTLLSNIGNTQSNYLTLVKELTTFYLNNSMLNKCVYNQSSTQNQSSYSYNINLKKLDNIKTLKNNISFFKVNDSSNNSSIRIDDNIELPVQYLSHYTGDILLRYSITPKSGQAKVFNLLCNITNITDATSLTLMSILYPEDVKSITVDIFKPINSNTISDSTKELEKLSTTTFNQTANKLDNANNTFATNVGMQLLVALIVLAIILGLLSFLI